MPAPASWSDVRASLFASGGTLDVPLADIEHPRDAGATDSIGLPRGQSEDWRFPPDAACRGLHVQRFGDTWRAHIDEVHPSCSLIGHARRDAPAAYVLGCAALGTAVGALAGKAYVGALLGSIFGAASLPTGSRDG